MKVNPDNWEQVKTGDKVKVVHKAYAFPEAIYEGEVIQNYGHFITCYGAPIPETMKDCKANPHPTPHIFTVNRCDVYEIGSAKVIVYEAAA